MMMMVMRLLKTPILNLHSFSLVIIITMGETETSYITIFAHMNNTVVIYTDVLHLFGPEKEMNNETEGYAWYEDKQMVKNERVCIRVILIKSRVSHIFQLYCYSPLPRHQCLDRFAPLFRFRALGELNIGKRFTRSLIYAERQIRDTNSWLSLRTNRKPFTPYSLLQNNVIQCFDRRTYS